MAMSMKRILFKAAGKVGDQIQENAEFIRESEQKKKDFLFSEALKNRGAVQKAQKDLMAKYNYLKSNGVEERRLKRYLQKSPESLEYLASMMQRDPDLTSTKANQYLRINEENPDVTGSLEDLIKNAFVGYDNVDIPDTPEAAEQSIWQRIFGGVDLDEINRNVARAEILPGVTGAQVIAGMDQFGSLKSGDGSMSVDRGALGAGKYDRATLTSYSMDLVNSYEDWYKDKIDNLTSLGTDEQETLIKIDGLKGTERLNAMIKANPDIAKGYLNQEFGPALFKSDNGLRAFDANTYVIVNGLMEDGEEKPTGDGEGEPKTGDGEGEPKTEPKVTTIKTVGADGRVQEVTGEVVEVEGVQVVKDPASGEVTSVVDPKTGKEEKDAFELAKVTTFLPEVNAPMDAKAKAWIKVLEEEGLYLEYITDEVLTDYFQLNGITPPAGLSEEILKQIKNR